MGARTKYRKRALDVLFESEMRGESLGSTLAARRETNDPPISEYTVRLVEGVAAEQERIDALIVDHARGWSLERMPAVDRNLVRVAVYEILFVDDVPPAVAVSEAVELAADLSTDGSPKFVGGLLGRIAEVAATS